MGFCCNISLLNPSLMENAFFVNKTPFIKGRLALALSVALLFSIVAVYQLSTQVSPWPTLHAKAPLVLLLELLPVWLVLFLLFATSKHFYDRRQLQETETKDHFVKNVSDIIQKIKSGEYNADRDVTGERLLDTSLSEIYKKFKTDADNERHRSWGNEGLARFREIMGSHTEIKALNDAFISQLIQYVDANQGGVFILNDERHLELSACYAFERKKYLTKTVLPGEGLVGQCFLEGHSIYLTKVPDDYVNITSGLGAANPQCILLVPLKVKEETLGVIELAAFKPFKKYKLDLIEKAAEALAQSISTVRVSEDTKKLLDKSLSREREMKDQEERMRQNMEELYVTQEDMRKVNLEMEELFKAINTLTATAELNLQGNILKLNDRLLQTLRFTAQDLYGKSFESLLTRDDQNVQTFANAWRAVQSGDSAEHVFTFHDSQKNQHWLRTGFYPLQGNDGVERILVFINDITEIKNKETELDQLNAAMEATRKMLIRILNEIPLKVFLKQYNGKFFVVNDAVSRFHGFDSPEGLIGKSDFDFYSAQDASDWLEAEHQIIATGRTEYIHPDGGKILHTIKMPFHIDPLNEMGILGLQADVTELETLRKEKTDRV
jgi:PAS domain S-box-containing protein